MANNLTSIYTGVKKNDPKRNKNDLYSTPPLATYALVKKLKDEMPINILEPCAGRGHIAIELERNGFEVKKQDLNHYESSLCEIETGIDAIKTPCLDNSWGVVTNPPYFKDLPRKLSEKYISEYCFVAMFLRLTFLEGKKRNELFTKNPPTDIIFLSDRVNFSSSETSPEPFLLEEQVGGMIAYAWFVWRKNKRFHNTSLSWVKLEDLYTEWLENYRKNVNETK